MTSYTFSDCSYRDLHKDVYGFRPCAEQQQWWNTASDDEKQAEWDRLVARLDEVMAEEELAEKHAECDLNAKIAELMGMGAKSVQQAAQWLLQSFQDEYVMNDIEYADYHFGVKYGTFRKLLA